MGMYVPRVRTVALKRIYNATITRWMAKGVAAIVATSEIELAELQPLSRFARVVLRRNGIDVAEFRTLPARELMRQRWGIPPDAKVVLYVGRISEKKRLLELVTAFEQAGVADAKLVIAGPVSEPSYASAMHRDVQRSSRKDDILVTEPVYDEHLKAALSAADLFVLPSLNENFGNAAAEAVAATLPVLLTETCGIAPIIDGRAGMAVRLGIEPLAQGMRQMLDPVIRDQFLVNREQVKRELSWEEPIRQQIEIYREAIARNTEKLKR
jgi:glycosyltransferase involved in cell wall biosynthesis